VNLTHSHGVSKTNLNHEWINTQNSLDSPLDKTTKAYIFIIIIIIIIIIINMQAVQCLAPLTFLIDPCNEC